MEVLKEFIQVVKAEEFVEGHEVLEVLWKEWKNDPHKREESFILKGLINGSTALALLKMHRVEGALRVWDTFNKYKPLIHTCPSDATPLYLEAQTLLEDKFKALSC